jgi:TonB-linked SusC/RagA family outer membrane protein
MKNTLSIARVPRPLQKLLMIMKLTCILTVFCVLDTFANVNAQTVTLKMQDAEIAKVLSSIERQGAFRFLYNSRLKDLKQKVDVAFNNAEISEVLATLFARTKLTYRRLDNNLIAIRAEEGMLDQDIRITGKITSGDANEPVAAASVTIKGSTRGTSTNASGDFELSVPPNSTLVISAVGFVTQEIAVGSQTSVAIKLVQSNVNMDEVVVIGYGTASKRDLTGSIAKVSGKEIQDKPNTNPVASLQGKVAGLSIINSGTPGAKPDIRIRGTVSIGQVAPLYVVDGIFNDNIDYLNPNDIESIEILKDPSSLAIFGVKGATGVIAVTTKRAKAGQTVVNFNTAYGFKKLSDKIEMADAEQFKTLFAEERANNGITDPYDYTGLSSNTDWVDAVTRVGNFNTNNLSISSSSEKNRFTFGIGFTSDEGMVRHEKLERLQLALSDEFKINRNIKIGVNLAASRQRNPYDAGWVLDAARKVIPLHTAETRNIRVKNPYNPTGNDSLTIPIYSGLNVGLQTAGVINPLVQLENEWDKNVNIEYRTVGSAFAEINFLKNFTWRSTVYADISNVNNRTYSPLYYAYNPVDGVPYLAGQTTRVVENDNDWRKFQQDHILTYKKDFGDHSLTAMGGFTTYYFGNFNRTGRSSQQTGPTAQPIPNDKRFWYINNGFEDPSTTSAASSASEYTTVSFLGRALYNYQNKYYLNASIRNDASSRIPEKNRNQQFWAVGAAWEVTREDFMQTQTFLDFLKVKGSFGVLGNQSASNAEGVPLDYPFYPPITTGDNAVFGTTVYGAARETYLVSADLKWETVKAWEVGIELNAFQNRLHFEANYFNKTTDDLMTYVNRAAIGLNPKLINGGSIRNWGEEFMASWNQQFSRDLVLNISGNITFLQNEVKSLAADLPTGYLTRGFMNNASAEARTVPGYAIGSYYGYVVEGIYQSYTDILRSPVASSLGAYRPGDFKFKDINEDGVINAEDRTFIGNPTPKFTYGASASLSYKGLSLSVDINGVYGNQVFRTWGSLESPFQRVNYAAFQIERWHGPGTSNWVPLVSQADRFNYNGSTYNMEDGSYVRLRNVQLAYSIPKAFLSRFKVKDLRVFANVQNLKTWKNNNGYSPEFTGDATAFGFDFGGGALPRITTFGLNVTF